MKKEIIAGLSVVLITSVSRYIWNYAKFSKLKGKWEGKYQCSLLKPEMGTIKEWSVEDAGNFSFLVRVKYQRGNYKGKVECTSANQSWFGIKLNCENDENGDQYSTSVTVDGEKLKLTYIKNKNCETGELHRIK